MTRTDPITLVELIDEGIDLTAVHGPVSAAVSRALVLSAELAQRDELTMPEWIGLLAAPRSRLAWQVATEGTMRKEIGALAYLARLRAAWDLAARTTGATPVSPVPAYVPTSSAGMSAGILTARPSPASPAQPARTLVSSQADAPVLGEPADRAQVQGQARFHQLRRRGHSPLHVVDPEKGRVTAEYVVWLD